MRKSWCNVVVFVLLSLCVFLIVPAEDVPETTYDESEALPYEGIAPFLTPTAQQSIAGIFEADLDRGSLFRSNLVMKRCQLRREDKARSEQVSDSITILNGSLRC